MTNLELARRDSFIATAQIVLLDWAELTVPVEKLNEILTEKYKDEYMDIDYEGAVSMDTCVREGVYDEVSLALIGEPAPCYGDQADIDAYLAKLYAAAAN